ncbi:MAG: hypothetical protein K0M56_03695 [Kaistella sp.]|nr:hypothetical protein [Kaistella sp.]
MRRNWQRIYKKFGTLFELSTINIKYTIMEENQLKPTEDSGKSKANIPVPENNNDENPLPRIKDLRNPVITQEDFVKDAENAVPPLAWKNQKKAYNDAWENNRNQNLED